MSRAVSSFPIFGSFLSKMTVRQVYLVLAALIANFPDTDALVTLIGRLDHHKWHRTWTHSILGSFLIIPCLSTSVFYNMKPHSSYLLAFVITTLSFYSHLYTDWITSYGIGLGWPNDKSFYSLGVMTIFDMGALLIWYASFMASCYRLASHTAILIAFSVSLTAWLIFKRLLLYVALKYTFTLSKAPIKDFWLQPSSLRPHVFACFVWTGQEVVLLEEINVFKVYKLEQVKRSIKPIFREAFFGRDLGYNRAAPREALARGTTTNSVYHKWMRKQTYFCLALVAAHFVWFVIWLSV